MATRIEIEGLGIVEVDDSFRSKTPDEQNSIVADIKQQILASQSQKPNSSLGTAAKYGAADTARQVAQFAADAAETPGTMNRWINQASDYVKTNIENPVREWLGAEPQPLSDELRKKSVDTYTGLAAQQQKKRDALNYAPKIAGLSEVGGVGDFGQYLAERGAQMAAPMAATALTGGMAGPLIGMANVNDELRQIEGLDPETRMALSSVAGVVVGALDATGLGIALKGLPKSKLAQLAAPNVVAWLSKKGVSQAALRTIAAGAAEGSTEMIQEGVQMAAAALGGKDFTASEVGSRLAEAGVAGMGIGTGVRAGSAVVQSAPGAVMDTSRAIRDVGVSRQLNAQSPEQTASDLRVGKLFDDMKASQAKADTGTAQADDVTFKKVQDRISAEIKSSVSQLYQSDQIDKSTYDRLIGRKDNILKQADQHNRDLSQEDLDVLQALPLEPAVKQGLIDAFRDLNTITNAGLKKNARGPLERAAKVALPVAAGVLAPPTMGGSLAALGAKGVITAGARKLDNILGLQTPEILRRIRVAQRRNKGAAVGDTAHFLSDLSANAQAGVNVQNAATAAETRSQRLMRAKRRMADNPGLAGFDRYIYDQTGLLPSEVDKGLLKLVQDGTITEQQQKAFYQSPAALKEGNQGNVIMDMLNDMAVKGALKRNAGWQGLRPEALPNAQQGGTEGIRNIYAYRQTMRNVGDATSTAQQSAPTAELRQAVNDIANARTVAAKTALFEQIKAANPQHAQWLDEVVSPLTQYGPKDAAPAETAAPASENVSGGGLGIRPSPIGAIPGAPGRLPAALAPEFRPAGSARLPKAALKPGKRLPISDVAREEARVYKAKKKIATPELTEHLEPSRAYLEGVGDFLENAKHDPNDPEVKKSYTALIKETVAQFKAIGKDLKVTPFKGEGEPYRNSREAMQDIVRNRHLYYFRTESGFGEGADTTDHPMLQGTGIRDADGNELVANDVFRIVHDYFGHSQNGFQFGPKGEYNAFQEHARMYSPAAVPALAAETLAQNAWVNFGPHMRTPEAQALSQKERRFADQKAFIVPWSELAKDPNPQGIASVLGLAQQAEPKGDRISTRLPTNIGALEDPNRSDLQIGVAAMRQSKKAFDHNTELIKTYPGFKTEATTPEGVAKDFVEHVKGNLLWLFDQVPADIRERSRRWYDGANRIASELAAEYALPTRSAAAVLAALSPQKDWYQNVSLAERLLDIAHTKTDIMPTEEMKANVPEALHKYGSMLGTVLSKPLRNQPDVAHKALWLRLYDEAHNPRSYDIITPEGDKAGQSSNDVAWGSLTEIGKAIAALSKTSREGISGLMGEKHKVRSFYNNIVDPKADRGDVTIDTHAVAAGLLRPLAGSHAEVHHNFGSSPLKAKQPKGWVPAKKVGSAGAVGTYGLYADAYRQAAAERGVLPREMQSITWEAVRGLFSPSLKKSKKAVAEIDNIWRQYQNGRITLDQAREQIRAKAGGIDGPAWSTGRDAQSDEDL